MLTSIFLCVASTAIVQSFPTSSTLFQKRQSQNSSIPQFVLDHAPLLWLDTDEQFFPSDIAAQLANTYPTVNQTPISNPPPIGLPNLNDLNSFGDNGKDVYLHSNEGIATYQSTTWMAGVRPSSSGSTGNATTSVIITVPKANNILDAFYFSFWAFDQGNFLFEDPNLELGDHVGDWEHTTIRFDTSTIPPTPTLMWFSQHSYGQAFTYDALEKDPSGLRPYAYAARGTHANYAIPGPHDHTLPDGFNTLLGPLIDHTSRGTLWDPILNSYFYQYDTTDDRFIALDDTSEAAGTGWLYFNGRWGDPRLPDSDPAQKDFFSFKKFDDGPTGPRDKNLGRTNVCPDGKDCTIRPILVP